jgi:triosephosphate isomerase
MLSELGCTYVVVGHLERRDLFGEDDDTVARKARAAMKYGLVPVVCVGEPAVMPIRQARQFVIKQLVSSLKGVPDAPIIVAYEPSFAIGADQPAPADHVVRVTTAIREALSSRTAEIGVLYGGTAGPGTLRALQEQCTALPVDGLFLGRRAHDVAQLAQVLSEMAAVIRRQTDRALPDSRAGQLGRAERRSARG